MKIAKTFKNLLAKQLKKDSVGNKSFFSTKQEERKVYTFSAGPCIFPMEVLRKAQEELVDYRGIGISVLEMSHRSKEFTNIIETAESDLRELLSIPKNYKVMFLQGGGTLQFASVPLNLAKGGKANYLVTGQWSEKSLIEAKKYCSINEVFPYKTLKDENYTKVPSSDKFNIDPKGEYFYYADNETIAGVEFSEIPKTDGQLLVCDMSSNFCSKPVDVSKYGLIFAGAQKNVGPAGVTIVIVREDLLGNALPITPIMCDYQAMAKGKSLYNTGPTYSIYLAGLFFDYLKKKGGLAAINEESIQKSNILYDLIENSNGYYINPVQKEFRSRMNIPFRIKNDADLEKKFLQETKADGLMQLAGYRTVGGCRASFYNGMSLTGVKKLRDFMHKFMKENQ